MPTGSQYTAELQFQPRAIPSPKSATFIMRLTRLPERTLNEPSSSSGASSWNVVGEKEERLGWGRRLRQPLRNLPK